MTLDVTIYPPILAGAAIPVKIVSGPTFSWTTLITPGLTFLGAVLGVISGAVLSRRTMFAVEEKRSERELELDERKRARDEAVEKRQAHGVVRVLTTELDERRLRLQACVTAETWAAATSPMAISLADSEVLARWVSDDVWDQLAWSAHHLSAIDSYRPQAGSAAATANAADLERLQRATGAVDQAINALKVATPALSAPKPE